ncbi:MAG: hypothetical protein J7K39_00570, partial [Bacteroidales bacterium]|nr:hypothetical protein [Bacteroidales bacterium]
KRLPVELVYFEEFERIDKAFYREKQVQGWSRKKKEALIKGEYGILLDLSVAYRNKETLTSRASTDVSASVEVSSKKK